MKNMFNWVLSNEPLELGQYRTDSYANTIALKWDILDQNPRELVIKWSKTSARTNIVKVDKTKLYMLRHELVASAFSDILKTDIKTDVRLDDIYGPMGSGDNLTPDIAKVDNDKVYLIEVATTRNSDASRMNIPRDNKVIKYTAPIRYRSTITKKVSFLGVVVVNHSVVLSNLHMSQDQIDLLTSLFRMSNAIASGLSSKYSFNHDAEDDLEGFFSKFKDRIPKSAPLPFISRDTINDWEAKFTEWDKRPIDEILRDYLPEFERVGSKMALEYNSFETNLKLKEKFIKTAMSTSIPKKDRGNMKCPIRIPMFTPELTMPKQSLCKIVIGGGESVLSKIWMKATKYYVDLKTPEPSLEANLKASKEMFDHGTVNSFKKITISDLLRMSRKRVMMNETIKSKGPRNVNMFKTKVNLNESEKSYLSSRGVLRISKTDPMAEHLKMEREATKSVFEWLHDTTDIDNFLKADNKWFEVVTKTAIPESARELVDLAIKFSGSTKAYEVAYSDFLWFARTRIGAWALAMSDIFTEVNISFHHYCTEAGDFLIKKSNISNIYALVKASGTDIDARVSLAIPEEYNSLNGTVFKNPGVNSSGFDIFDFESFPETKVVQLCKMFELLLGKMLLWTQSYQLKSMRELPKVLGAVKHFTYNTLILTEMSRDTPQNLSILRYATCHTMKGKTGNVPAKCFDKINTNFRSRLSLHCAKKIVENSIILAMDPPEAAPVNYTKKEKGPVDVISEVKGLKSILFPEESITVASMVNVCSLYLDAIREAPHWYPANIQIFQKIIKLEMEMEFAREEFMGVESTKNPEDLRIHEWSLEFAYLQGRMAADEITTQVGAVDAALIAAMERLIKTNASSLSTFKASYDSTADGKYPMMTDERLKKSGKFKSYKTKAIVNMSRFVVGGIVDTSCFENIDEIIGIVEDEEDGTRCYCFKKGEPKGIREIIVLSIPPRMTLKFHETVCEELCKGIGCEMMSKGEEKLTQVDKHRSKVQAAIEHDDEETITLTNSCDNKTWCQQFVMSYFGAVLYGIFRRSKVPWSKTLSNAIMAILNTVTNKKIRLPDQLLAQFIKNPEIRNFSPEMNELKEQFLGVEGCKNNLISEPGSCLLINKSNMMQGILGFCSSIMHAAYCLVVERLRKLSIEQRFKGVKVVSTYMVTSDDSSDITTYIVRKKNFISVELFNAVKKAILAFGEMLCYSRCLFYAFMCARISEDKSVIGSKIFFFEFNSKYFWELVTILAGLGKIFYASCFDKTVNDISQKTTQRYQFLRDLQENGADAYSLNVMTIAMALSQYRELGSMTNPIFPIYAEKLMKYPLSSFGFFSFTPSNCQVFGENMSSYLVLRRSENARLMFSAIKSTIVEETDDKGNLGMKIHVNFGDNRKHREFQESMEIDINWRTTYNERPDLNFREPENIDEYVAAMSKTVTNSATSSQFVKNSDGIMLRSSVYVINKPCVTLSFADADGRGKVKTSLMNVIDEIEKKITEDRTPKLMSIYYPYSETWDEMEKVHRRFGELIPIKGELTNRLFTYRFLDKPPVRYTIVVRRKWFAEEFGTPYSDTRNNELFEDLKGRFKWMQDTIQDTIKHPEVPFEDTTTLCDFIKKLDLTENKYRISTKCVSRGSYMTVANDMYNYNYKHGFVFGDGKAVELPEDRERYPIDQAYADIAYVVNSPLSDYNIYAEVKGICQKYVDETSTMNLVSLTDQISPTRKTRQILALIFTMLSQKKIKGKLDLTEGMIKNSITKALGSYWIKYEKKQTLDKGVWSGECVFKMKIGSLIAEIEIFDRKLKSIIVNSRRSYLANMVQLRRYLIENMSVEEPPPFYEGWENSMTCNFPTFHITKTGDWDGRMFSVGINSSMTDMSADGNEINIVINKGCISLEPKSVDRLMSHFMNIKPAMLSGMEKCTLRSDDWLLDKWYTKGTLNLKDMKRMMSEDNNDEKSKREREWLLRLLQEKVTYLYGNRKIFKPPVEDVMEEQRTIISSLMAEEESVMDVGSIIEQLSKIPTDLFTLDTSGQKLINRYELISNTVNLVFLDDLIKTFMTIGHNWFEEEIDDEMLEEFGFMRYLKYVRGERKISASMEADRLESVESLLTGDLDGKDEWDTVDAVPEDLELIEEVDEDEES